MLYREWQVKFKHKYKKVITLLIHCHKRVGLLVLPWLFWLIYPNENRKYSSKQWSGKYLKSCAHFCYPLYIICKHKDKYKTCAADPLPYGLLSKIQKVFWTPTKQGLQYKQYCSVIEAKQGNYKWTNMNFILHSTSSGSLFQSLWFLISSANAGSHFMYTLDSVNNHMSCNSMHNPFTFNSTCLNGL